MNGFWNRVHALEGKTITTVTGRASFTIIDVTTAGLTVKIASSGKERLIQRGREKFDMAFEKAAGSPIRPKDVLDWGLSRVHTPYIAAIVNEVLKERPGARA